MQESKTRIYLRNPYCRAAVVSKRPFMRKGLQIVMAEKAAESSLMMLEDYLDLNPEILKQVDVVMVELDCSLQESFEVCDFLTHLQNQYRHVYWIFMLPAHLVHVAIEKLFTIKTSLISLHEPLNSIIEHIFNSGGEVERISRYILQEKAHQSSSKETVRASLTFSERRVFRLISKGWQLTQIATLLEKNYKTVSAQKSSAMRRLSLKTDAEMYAWMISESGMLELNLPPYNQGC